MDGLVVDPPYSRPIRALSANSLIAGDNVRHGDGDELIRGRRFLDTDPAGFNNAPTDVNAAPLRSSRIEGAESAVRRACGESAQ